MESDDRHVGSPPVVVVVVCHDPQPQRFEVLLRALAGQDYPDLRVLVVDTASHDDPRALVRHVLPRAGVLLLDGDPGFGAAANHVLDVVDDAAYYVFCHDDVVPDRHAVSALVEVATAWEAAVVGPKLVDWDDPGRLRQVGMAVDRVGMALPFVEPGELDQAQRDGLRDVMLVPGAFTLVDAALFDAVGGFDEAITYLGDDLSLCWRAHVAGGRVLVASTAVVRHAEAFASRAPARVRRRLADRHRLRTLLTCYGRVQLALVLPLVALMAAAEALGAVATGRLGRARDVAGAWLWNARRVRSLRGARRHVRRIRRVPDRRLRALQVRGLLGPRLHMRRLGGDARMAASRGDRPDDADPAAWSPGTVVVWVGLLAVLAFGSRHLVTRFVPAVGEMVPLGGGAGGLIAEWTSGWRHAGLGSASAAPSLVGIVGALGSVLGGQMAAVRTLLTLGMVPLGVIGAHHLLRPTGSRRAQVAASVAYAAVPVPYNALAGGRWSALAAYAAAPWLLGRLARAAAVAPFRPEEAPLAVVRHPVRRHAVAAGAVTALMGLFVPGAPVLLVVMGAGLVLGSLLACEGRDVARLVAVVVGGAVVAAALALPTTLDALDGGLGGWLGADRAGGGLSAADLLRFETGQFGAAPLGFALVAAAVVPLLVARSWRLGWAVRGWSVALAFWGLAWAGQEELIGFSLPHPDVLLAPAAAGLALAVALGVAAVDVDVQRRSHRPGMRRLVAGLGTLALVAAAVPVAGAAIDGWWRMPRGDFHGLLAFVEDDVRDVPSRVLYLGDPDVLPGGAGWEWRDGLSYATSLEGGRSVGDLWPGPEDPTTRQLADALDLAADRRTTRLGRLLAPLGVQYVAVPLRSAPSPFQAEERPVPAPVIDALGSQLDLEQIAVDPAVALYRNTAFLPTRALVGDSALLDAMSLTAAQQVDVPPSFPVLPERGGMAYRGTLPAGVTLVHATAGSDRWVLEVAGEAVPRRDALGWASAYEVDRSGDAVLAYRARPGHRLLLVVQAVLWLAALVAVLRMRYGGEAMGPAAAPRPGAAGSDGGAALPPDGAGPGTGPPPGPWGGPGHPDGDPSGHPTQVERVLVPAEADW